MPAKTSPSSRCAAKTSFGLISMTGRLVVYTTFSAVLPSSARARADPPWVLITMQSTSSLWAAERISACGSPEGTRIRDFTDFPPSRKAIFSRYAFDRFTLSANALDSSACPASGAFPRGDGTTLMRRTSGTKIFMRKPFAGGVATLEKSTGGRVMTPPPRQTAELYTVYGSAPGCQRESSADGWAPLPRGVAPGTANVADVVAPRRKSDVN